MAYRWRIVAATAAVISGMAAAATAQTVYVRKAPAGSQVEVVINAVSAGTATVDAEGEAKVGFTLPDGKADMDSNVFVDTCDALRKVIIVDINRQAAAPAEGCDRREVPGIYWVRPVNTIVVDVGDVNPSLLLVRGNYTPPPVTAEGEEGERPSRPVPSGLLMFAGAAYSNYRDAALLACGNATPCTPRNSGFTYMFGADVWLTRYLGIEGAYIRPHQVTASGGDTFHFDSTLDSDVWTVAGKGGVQAGSVRLYGKAGMNYHEATNTTVETLGNATQTLAYKTTGWSWVWGGGMEAWMGRNQRWAIYADGGMMRIKGNAESGGEAKIDDRLRYVAIGIKLRLSR
jgi:hypothetical protein